MRTLTIAALLSLSLLAPAAAAEEEPVLFELAVGETKPLAGFRPLCDDPSVAAFSTDEGGALTGLKVGETVCSVSAGSPLGLRRIYRVVVTPRKERKGGRGG